MSKALLPWAVRESLDLALLDPGKPWPNGKRRDECLSMEWFRCRAEARAVIEEWRRHYNSVRPHASLGNMTPEDFSRMTGKTLHQGAALQNSWSEETRQVSDSVQGMATTLSARPNF